MATELQRLAFVQQGAERGYNLATTLYEGSKTYVPAGLKPRLEGLEQTVIPYSTAVLDKAREVLETADAKVTSLAG